MINVYHTFIDLLEMRDSGIVIVNKTGERYADTIQKGLILRLTGKHLLGSTILCWIALYSILLYV